MLNTAFNNCCYCSYCCHGFIRIEINWWYFIKLTLITWLGCSCLINNCKRVHWNHEDGHKESRGAYDLLLKAGCCVPPFPSSKDTAEGYFTKTFLSPFSVYVIYFSQECPGILNFFISPDYMGCSTYYHCEIVNEQTMARSLHAHLWWTITFISQTSVRRSENNFIVCWPSQHKVSVMIWGCLSFNGIGTVTDVKGNINSQIYIYRCSWK